MIRHDDDNNHVSSGTCYTLYLEYLGGLVPLLKGKRTSKIRPEFVIFDPQVEGKSVIEIPTASLLVRTLNFFIAGKYQLTRTGTASPLSWLIRILRTTTVSHIKLTIL